jgi:hypothetical protein
MAEKLDPRQVVTFEELLRAIVYQHRSLRRILVRKGFLSKKEILEEIKVVRWEFLEDVKAVQQEVKRKRGR